MATLTYDFAVVGQQNVKRALMSLERQFIRHNSKIKRMFGAGGAGTSAKVRAVGTPGRAAKAAEKARHTQATTNIASEERARARAEHRIHRIARRNQKRRARENRRDRERAAKEAVRAEARARRQFQGATTRVVGGTGRTLAGIGRAGMLAAGMYGGFAVAGAVGSQMSADRAKRNLANQAVGQFGGASREELLGKISGATKPLAAQTGRTEAEITGMMGQFHGKAGGLQQAIELAPFMAQLAEASGSEMADIGEAAGSVFQSAVAKGMDPKDAGKAVKELMSAMAGQAKEGSIELKDMAALGSRIVSSGTKFEGGFNEIGATMSALAQVALAGGASSAREATTAVMRLGPDMAKRGKRFKKQGVNIWADEDSQLLRDPTQVLMETVAKTKGSQAIMTGLFGEESAKITDAFRGAYVSAGGGDAGMKAMQALVGKYKGLAMTETEVTESSRFSREGTDTRLGQLRERFNEKIGPAAMRVIERLIPAFEKLIPHLEKGAEHLADFVGWFSDNPLKGLGAIIGAAFVKELAIAGIGSILQSALGAVGPKAMAAAGGLGAVAAAAGSFALAYDQWSSLMNETGGENPGEALRNEEERRRNHELDLLANMERMGVDPVLEEDGKRFRLSRGKETRREYDDQGQLREVEREVAKREEISFADAEKGLVGAADSMAAKIIEAANALKKSAKAGPGGNRGSSPTEAPG